MDEITIAIINEKMAQYTPAFELMEHGSASLADAKIINEAVAALRPYLDMMQEKASAMLRAREQLEVILAALPQDKRDSVLAALGG